MQTTALDVPTRLMRNIRLGGKHTAHCLSYIVRLVDGANQPPFLSEMRPLRAPPPPTWDPWALEICPWMATLASNNVQHLAAPLCGRFTTVRLCSCAHLWHCNLLQTSSWLCGGCKPQTLSLKRPHRVVCPRKARLALWRPFCLMLALTVSK